MSLSIVDIKKRGVTMHYKKYFEKNGVIYGVSYIMGMRNTAYTRTFHKLEDAEKWLNEEEYQFRTRKLCSKTTAERYK